LGRSCDIINAETAMASFPLTPSFFSGVYSTWSNRVRHVVSIVVLNFGSSRPWKSEPGSTVLGYTDVSRWIAVQLLGSIQWLYPSCEFCPFSPALNIARSLDVRCWRTQALLVVATRAAKGRGAAFIQVPSEKPRGGICDGATVGQTYPKYRGCILALPQDEPIRNAPRKRTGVPGGGAKAVTVLACT
jgi:hypothetical protein